MITRSRHPRGRIRTRSKAGHGCRGITSNQSHSCPIAGRYSWGSCSRLPSASRRFSPHPVCGAEVFLPPSDQRPQTLPAKGIAGCRIFAGSSPDWQRSGRISTPRGAEPRGRTERIAPLSIRWRLGMSGSVAALQSYLCNALTLKERDTGPPGVAADPRRARSIPTRCCCRPGRDPRRTNSPGAGRRCTRISGATSRGAPAPDIRVRNGARVKSRASA